MPGNSDDEVPVAIIGGGIGGLAVALALRKRGIEAFVLERASEFREGLLLSPNACKVLDSLGVLPDLLESSVETPDWDLLNPKGHTLSSLKIAKAKKLLERMAPDSLLQHSIFDTPPRFPWRCGDSVTFLGDAAHPLTPNLGQGSAMAHTIKKPSIEDLGKDLLETTIRERIFCLALPFVTMAGFFFTGSFGWWFVAIPLAVAQSFFTYASVSHDLVHRNLKIPLWLNETLLFLIEGTNFRSGHSFRVTHLYHHQHFPDASDLEGSAARMSWWRALLEGVIAQPRLWFHSFKRKSGKIRLWLLAEALFILILAALCARSDVGRVYLVLIVAGSWGFPFMTSYLPHKTDSSNPVEQTRLFRGRVIEILFWNHLYHLEHHLYPRVPHQRWPELSRRLDSYFNECGLTSIVLFR